MKITLKDGKVIEAENGKKGFEIAALISEGLARNALAMKVNGEVTEINAAVNGDANVEFLTFNDDEGKKVYRHTAAHVFAQAVKRLFPNAKLAFGPATDEGFFYDVDVETPLTADVLEKIEAEMKKII